MQNLNSPERCRDYLLQLQAAVAEALPREPQAELTPLQNTLNAVITGNYTNADWGTLTAAAQKHLVISTKALDLREPAQYAVAQKLMQFLPPWEHCGPWEDPSLAMPPALRALAPSGRVVIEHGKEMLHMPPDKPLMDILCQKTNDAQAPYDLAYTDGLSRTRTAKIFLTPSEKASWQKNWPPQAEGDPLPLPERLEPVIALRYEGPQTPEPKRYGVEMECKGFQFSYPTRVMQMEMFQKGNQPMFKLRSGMEIHLDIAGEKGIFELVTPPKTASNMASHLVSSQRELNTFLDALRQIGRKINASQTLKGDSKTKSIQEARAGITRLRRDYNVQISDHSLAEIGKQLAKFSTSANLAGAILGKNTKLCQVTTSVTASEFRAKTGSDLAETVRMENAPYAEADRFKGASRMLKVSTETFSGTADANLVQIGREKFRRGENGALTYDGRVSSRPNKAAPFGKMIRKGEPVVLVEHREETEIARKMGNLMHGLLWNKGLKSEDVSVQLQTI
ncbi:MAG: hypothetical protein ACO1RX_11850 [Candidatus Sericytochromatia bacterium]